MSENGSLTISEQIMQEVDGLDRDVSQGLYRLLNEDPERLREFLIANGYIGVENAEDPSPESTASLPRQQELLYSCISEMGVPRSAEEMVDYVQSSCPELVEEYNSATHRSWLSKQLKELGEAGKIGRYRDGRTIKYTSDTESAINYWALQNDIKPEQVGERDIENIVSETGMSRDAVEDVIGS
jgi:hypothetical protein